MVDKLVHASGAVVSLAASLEKVCDENCDMSGRHGEQLSTERPHSDVFKA